MNSHSTLPAAVASVSPDTTGGGGAIGVVTSSAYTARPPAPSPPTRIVRQSLPVCGGVEVFVLAKSMSQTRGVALT